MSLFCLAASWPQVAFAAEGEGTLNAAILDAVEVNSGTEMSFGVFTSGTQASVYRINPNTGAVTRVNGNAVNLGGTTSAASFTVAGAANRQVRITLGQNQINLIRDNGTERIRLNRFTIAGGRNRQLNNAGTLTFLVGGQIRILPGQRPGIYRGTFNLTVDYR